MELDELKYQLKNKLSGAHDKSADDLVRMLRIKTTSLIDKLKRSLYIEVVCAIVFTLLFAGIALFASYWSLRIYFGVFSVVFGVFSFIIGYLIRRVNDLSKGELAVKTNISALVKIIQEYVKRSFQFTMWLLPVCVMFSIWLGYNQPPQSRFEMANPFIIHLKAKTQVYIFFTVYFGGVAVGLYYVTKWYLKKLYGNYIKKLKLYLSELEETS